MLRLSLILFIQVALLLGTTQIFAQDDAFKGGSGDGFTYSEYAQGFDIFSKGDTGDGFSFSGFEQSFDLIFMGNSGDGFFYAESNVAFLDITQGGKGDGFEASMAILENNDITRGGSSDGFSHADSDILLSEIYKGGMDDGFAYGIHGHKLYWTGAVGTGWNVSGNWSGNIVPSYYNPVVIPASVPNFPALNAGVFRIQNKMNDGDFLCQKIKINDGAEITTRVNCFVENFEQILIQGNFFVKNPAAGAFTNKGAILLDANATLIFKEN